MSADPVDPPPSRPLPPPLQRAREGRWLAGVCRGLADRWDLPVAQVRALFAVAAAFAGVGVLAYVAFWLVLPAPGDAEGPSVLRGIASLAVLGAACAGLLTIAVAAWLATVFGLGWAVAVAGGVFLAGALVAWPTLRPAWILLPLAAAALPAAVTAATGVRIERQAGTELVAPRDPAGIPAGGYRTGLGDLFVDLRGFEAAPGEIVELDLETGIGDAVVALPRDRCFDLDVAWDNTGVADEITREAYARMRDLVNRDGWWSSSEISLYGRAQLAGSRSWTRRSSDPEAPTLRIRFTTIDGGLWVRDYPDSVGPLHNRWWPADVQAPASPAQRRAAWAVDSPKPAVQRRWRAWRKAMREYHRRKAELERGACAPATKAARR